MKDNFTLVSHSVVKDVLSVNPNSIYEIIKRAYLAHEAGNTVMPGSCFLHFPSDPHARIIALPAYIAEEFNMAGIKWVASNPKNTTRGLPRASAVIILNNPNTGRPFACIEGALISAKRTAVSAVLAAEYMYNQNKKLTSLGIVGNGPIGLEIYNNFIQRRWDIEKLTLFDSISSASERFQSKIKLSRHSVVHVASSIEELMTSCNAIVFATTAASPYVDDFNLVKHCSFILNISLRDIGPNILLNSNNVVDDIKHVLNANTSPHLTQKLCGNTNFINGTLGALMQEKIHLDPEKPNVFSPMGLGILDLALAKYVFDNAVADNRQISISGFFEDEQ